MPLSEPADWPTPFVAAPTTPANQGPIFSQGSRPCAASILELKLGKKKLGKNVSLFEALRPFPHRGQLIFDSMEQYLSKIENLRPRGKPRICKNGNTMARKTR